MNAQYTLKTILMFEFGLVILAIIAMSFIPSIREESGILKVSSIVSLFAMLHLLIVPFKGMNFIIRNEKPSSIWTLYWFITIFLATFFSPIAEKPLVNIAVILESAVI